MKWFIPSGVILLCIACSGGDKDNFHKPFRFDRDALDKLVKEKKALYDMEKRGDGTLMGERYYLGDTAKYELIYDQKSNLKVVTKYDEHGMELWEETYYPNGQRKSHYNHKTLESGGHFETILDGYYEQYYENGDVMERGLYKNRQMQWNQKISKEGYPADTLHYDYGDDDASGK